jgi:hypothetical protein
LTAECAGDGAPSGGSGFWYANPRDVGGQPTDALEVMMSRRRFARIVTFPYLSPVHTWYEEGSTMTFEDILAHVIEVLQREGRISSRSSNGGSTSMTGTSTT